MFGKQHRHCPNCGTALYDDRMSMNHVQSQMCGAACRSEWEMKYTRSILGKNAEQLIGHGEGETVADSIKGVQ